MGGDEFVLVLPNIQPEAVPAKALQLRQIASQAGRQICDGEVISLSVGGASYPRDGSDAETLLAEADRRMYKTKQQQKELSDGQVLIADLHLHTAMIQ
jgi:diguanylate cyclase (GGDEF)-like protein